MFPMNVLITTPPGYLSIGGRRWLEMTVPTTSIYALGAVLERHGHQVSVLDPATLGRSHRRPGAWETLCLEHDVICLSASSRSWPLALRLAHRCKAAGGGPVVVGGVHASHCDEHVARLAPVDVVVRGEGERTLPLVLDALHDRQALARVPGVTLTLGDELVRAPDAVPLTQAELDDTPLPLWDQLPEKTYRLFPVELSRGCLYACRFCSIYHKRNWRGYSWEAIRRRLDQAAAEVNRVTNPVLLFSDDCFTADPARLVQVADYLARTAPEVEIGIEARADDLARPEVQHALARMRVGFIQIGAECGYADGLRRVGKGIKVEQLERAAEILHRLGMSSAAKFSYIAGLPWESLVEIKRTIAFAMHLGSRYGNIVQITWYHPFPGGAFFDQLLERGLFSLDELDSEKDGDWGYFFRTHPELTVDDFHEARDFARHLERTYPWVSVIGNLFVGPEKPHLHNDHGERRVIPPWFGHASVNEVLRAQGASPHAGHHHQQQEAT